MAAYGRGRACGLSGLNSRRLETCIMAASPKITLEAPEFPYWPFNW